MPTERPILFSGAMVRAILAGKKTQTRRVVKYKSWYTHPQDSRISIVTIGSKQYWFGAQFGHPNHLVTACPYGQPGDRLWVRETWCQPCYSGCGFNHPGYKYDALYAADNGMERHSLGGNWTQYNRDFKWRPSIFMPRLYSRITLEVVSVRVERLQDISEADALAEGAPNTRIEEWYLGIRPRSIKSLVQCAHREGFEFLWDSINGKRPGCAVADNPWVWVVELKRANP